MTIHVGNLTETDGLLAANSSLLSANLIPADRVLSPITSSGYAADILGFSGPNSYVERYTDSKTQSGAKGITFYDDLYERVHIEPAKLALGNLVSSQIRNVKIWNAHVVPKTYNSLVAANNESIEVTAPFAAGTDFAGLQESTFIFNIATDGPSAIAANYIFTIGGELLPLSITGSRVTMMLSKNNWGNGVVESLEWLTSVVKSYSGVEQRSAGRSKPRRKLRYDYTMNNSEARYMESLLWGWQSRLFAIPVWTDSQTITQEITAGTTQILIDTNGLSYYAGGLLLLSSGYKTFEAVEISSVEADRVILTLPLSQAWYPGSVLMPANLARMPQSVKLLRKTNTLFTTTIDWQCDPVETDPYVPQVDAPLLYNGLELMTKKPNWSTDLSTDYGVDTDILDYATGAIGVIDRTGYPTVIKKHQWMLKDRSEVTELRKFLRRREGRLVPFYMSTFNEDLKITATVGAAAATITVEDDGYFTFVNAESGRNHAEFITTEGTFYREIIGSSDNGNGTLTLTIDSNLGFELISSQFKRVSFLNRYRLFSDKLTINWKSKDLALVEINTLGLS